MQRLRANESRWRCGGDGGAATSATTISFMFALNKLSHMLSLDGSPPISVTLSAKRPFVMSVSSFLSSLSHGKTPHARHHFNILFLSIIHVFIAQQLQLLLRRYWPCSHHHLLSLTPTAPYTRSLTVAFTLTISLAAASVDREFQCGSRYGLCCCLLSVAIGVNFGFLQRLAVIFSFHS